MMTLISGKMELDTCKRYFGFKTALTKFDVVCVHDMKSSVLLHVGKEGINEVLEKYKTFKFIEFYGDNVEMVIEVA